jgi:hypothetical protein
MFWVWIGLTGIVGVVVGFRSKNHIPKN